MLGPQTPRCEFFSQRYKGGTFDTHVPWEAHSKDVEIYTPPAGADKLETSIRSLSRLE